MSIMNITFIPLNPDALLIDIPKPSRSFVPEWYKKIDQPHLKKIKIDDTGLIKNTNLKMCVPFLDAMTHGYTVSSWCDIYIEKENEQIKYYYSSSPEILKIRDKVNYPAIDNNFYQIEFAWQMYWLPKTPCGYSTLISHPANRIDLPFYTLSGIIDSDKFYHHGPGNLPFFIKNGFTGIIPAKTPLYQIIPIKRENWNSFSEPYNEFKNKKRNIKRFENFFGVYKNKFWQKKEFN
jgi:hypothetical protein